MGVELGKAVSRFWTLGPISSENRADSPPFRFQLAKAILPTLEEKKGNEGHDSSTTGLINYWLQHKL